MSKTQDLHILLVDDKPANLTSLRALLEDFDVNLVEAISGNEALTHTLSIDFALVLLDVQMPDMDGYETAELMRGTSKTRHVPIIFVTAINKEERHIFKGYEAGAVDYLAKPLDPHVLRSKVNVFLELYRQKLELKQQNEVLREANEIIIAQQKSAIEEERLKVLLQMSGATVHEMNQPLNALLGNIELLEQNRDGEDMLKAHITEIKKASLRIQGIINDFQSFKQHEIDLENNNSFVGNIEQHLNVLSIEDEDEDYHQIESILSAYDNISLFRAGTIELGIRMLKEHSISIVLLDYILPDGNGFDFITACKQEDVMTPFSVITGHGDEVVAAKIIQAGALDYLPKDKLNKSSLVRTLFNCYEKARLLQEVKEKNAQLAMMLREDELTGTYNRRFFNESLENEFERAKRYNQEMVLLMMDIDYFKSVNDTYGHPVGDIVLTKLGQELIEITRHNDIVCRFGGEEFVVILPNADRHSGFEVAEKIRKRFTEIVFKDDLYDFTMTISIGCVSSQDAVSPGQFLDFADKALYQAKESGRNKVVLYEGDEV